MNRRVLFLSGGIVVSVICACADATGPGKQNELELLGAVASLGFQTSEIQDFGSYVAVEHDILLSKADLRSLSRAGQTTKVRSSPSINVPIGPRSQWLAGAGQATSARMVNLTGIANRPEWVAATRAAMEQWNSIPGAAVNWVESASPGAVQVVSGGCPENGVACASFPMGGQVGTSITITWSVEHYDASQKMRLIAHELGHTLGLRHSNWQARGEARDGATLIQRTPSTDAQSVMNGSTAGLWWSGFSNGDQVAASQLYRPVFPAYYSPSGPSVSWPSQGDLAYYHAFYFRRWYSIDEYGYPEEHWDEVDLGDIFDTSVILPDAHTGDANCGNSVSIAAIYPSGAWAIASAPAATCTSASY